MARLVLHIGLHKTATSYVQALLGANRLTLRLAGIHVPRGPALPGGGAAHHGYAGVWNRRFAASPEAAAAGWRALADRHAGRGGTVILSSEELSRLFGPAGVDFARMRALCQPFTRVTVLCVLRDQAEFLQSAYAQIARQRPAPRWEHALDIALGKRRFDGLTLDYDRLYSRLRAGFARSEIRLISYDAHAADPGGVPRALLCEIGAGRLWPILRKPDAARGNVSPPPMATWLAVRQARGRPVRAQDLARAGAALDAAGLEAARTTLFTQAEHRALRDAFAASNRALEARVAERQPGFRILPPARGAPIWRDAACAALAADPAPGRAAPDRAEPDRAAPAERINL